MRLLDQPFNQGQSWQQSSSEYYLRYRIIRITHVTSVTNVTHVISITNVTNNPCYLLDCWNSANFAGTVVILPPY